MDLSILASMFLVKKKEQVLSRPMTVLSILVNGSLIRLTAMECLPGLTIEFTLDKVNTV